MRKIEIQEIIDVCEESNSEYIKLYRPLLGYEDDVELNLGIDDTMEDIINEIEYKVGIRFPADFLQVYLLANGGKYFDVNLYYVTIDKKDKKGLYFVNNDANIRREFDIPQNMLIIGEIGGNELILIGINDDGYYYYCTWSKETCEKSMEFDYLAEILTYEIDYYTKAFSAEE